jgi:Di-haem oxidoreductase, putative peroxidase
MYPAIPWNIYLFHTVLLEDKMISKLFKLAAVLAIALMALSADGCPQEAPQSFVSQNGLLSQERFDAAQEAFEEVETPRGGLGVHFNESSCLGCHAPPSDRGLPGGSSPVTELRAGRLGGSNEFVPAPGGTLITAQAVGEAMAEVKALPDIENVRDRFITPSLFGAGFVECVADETLRRIAREQATQSGGRIRGLVREVPILEAPEKTGVGRFGWAAQHASLLSFSADAYRNEMGITSPLEPKDNTFLGQPVDDGVADPEDTGNKFGEDVELFTDFMRALSAPPRLLPSGQKEREEIEEGFKVFKSIGCAVCHLPELVTAKTGSLVNGGAFRVPKALGNKRFHPYGDFLLHDIGTGPNILREGLPPEARKKIRTAALWGMGSRLANSDPLLHDGSARTLEEAVQRHKNSAAQEAEKFQRLSDRERIRLLKFLRSL